MPPIFLAPTYVQLLKRCCSGPARRSHRGQTVGQMRSCPRLVPDMFHLARNCVP